VELSWTTIRKLTKDMFTDAPDGKPLSRTLGFYGSDGVCLFKYLVGLEDPQRWFVWGTTLLNCTCFLTIISSYLLVHVITARSSSKFNNKSAAAKNRAFNLKIQLIILTDVLCWVPFLIVCLLHTFGWVLT